MAKIILPNGQEFKLGNFATTYGAKHWAFYVPAEVSLVLFHTLCPKDELKIGAKYPLDQLAVLYSEAGGRTWSPYVVIKSITMINQSKIDYTHKPTPADMIEVVELDNLEVMSYLAQNPQCSR